MAANSGAEGFLPTGGDFGAVDQRQASKEMDEQQLQKIFNHFDSDGSGSIDVDELRSAMMALGIKVTISSCKKILDIIDKDKNGTIEWDEFHSFFEKVKDPEEIKSLLSAANAKYMDYKQMVEGDPNFEKRFFVPPIKSNTFKFQGHEDNVECVSWLDAKSASFLSSSLDGTLRIWNTTTGQLQETVVEGYARGFYCHGLLEGGTRALAGCGTTEKNAILFDLKKGSANPEKMGESPVLMEFNGPNAPIYSLSVEKTKSPARFICGAKNGKMAYFDLTKPDPVSMMEDIHEGVIFSVDLHGDGNKCASCSSDGLIQISDFRASGGWKATTTIEDAAASGVPYSALWRGDRELLSCGDDYCVKKWDIRALRQGPVENYLGHTSAIRKITLSDCGKYVVSAANDGGIRVWIVDERTYIQQEQDIVNQKIVKAEKERKRYDEVLYEGEEDLDEDALKKCVYDLEKSYRRSKNITTVKSEREAMQCVQASVSLEGHQLPITALAMRTHPNDSAKAEIVSGSQDQTCMNYVIKKPKLTEFVRWSRNAGEEGGEVSP